MKCIFVASPLRGSDQQIRDIDAKVERSVSDGGWYDRDAESRTMFIALSYKHYRRELVASNVALCKKLCMDLSLLGHAPWAPHLFYPLFLDDADEFQRNLGIEMGAAWMSKSDEVWAYRHLGVSSGMRYEIEAATALGKPVLSPPGWMP